MVLLLCTSCNESDYDAGYQAGYIKGFQDGSAASEKAYKNTLTQIRSRESAKTSAFPAEKESSPTNNYYVLNKKTKKFHKPTCGSVSQMKEANKEISYETRTQIIADGYSPCGNCNP